MEKKRFIVICTGNSCRSQMAEGLFRKYGNGKIDVYSAGTHPSFVHPRAISVMQEMGIDISGHLSEGVNQYVNDPFDYVITVCDIANERCPVFSNGKERLHWGFDDPTASGAGPEKTGAGESAVMKSFRRVRDQIGKTIYEFLNEKSLLDSSSQ